MIFRATKKSLPDTMLFPWSIPNGIGFSMDPTEKAGVLSMDNGSAAEKADFRQGDVLTVYDGRARSRSEGVLPT